LSLTIYQFPDKKNRLKRTSQETTDILVEKASRLIDEYDPKKDYWLIDFKRKLRRIDEGMVESILRVSYEWIRDIWRDRFIIFRFESKAAKQKRVEREFDARFVQKDKKQHSDTRSQELTKKSVEHATRLINEYDPKKDPALKESRRKLRDIWRQ